MTIPDWQFNIINQAEKATNVPVPSQTTVYTKHFNIYLNHIENPSFCFEYRATSSGAVALKIELEQSNYEPTNDKASDPLWAIPDDALEFNDALVDEVIHYKAYPPVPMLYGRFKITGLTGNDASTVIDRLILTVMK